MEKNFNRTLTSKSTKSKKSNASRSSKKREDTKKAEEEAKKKADEEDAKSQGGKTEGETSIVPPEIAAVFDPSLEPMVKEKGWFTKQNI